MKIKAEINANRKGTTFDFTFGLDFSIKNFKATYEKNSIYKFINVIVISKPFNLVKKLFLKIDFFLHHF